MTQTEEAVVPLIILAAVAGFVASKFLSATVAPEKRTVEMRAQMQNVQELRKVKQEYLDVQEAQQDENLDHGAEENDG